MARQPLNKGQIASNASPSPTDVGHPAPPNKLQKAALFIVNNSGNITPSDFGVFLINPETIEDTKQSNWALHNIPGQSDPVLQWTHGGPRVVSFEALITRDTTYYNKPSSTSLDQLAGQAVQAIGSIASAFAGINIPLGFIASKLTTKNPQQNNLDISDYLDYYRSLLYPTYNNSKQLSSSPPLLVLYFNSSLGTPFGSPISGQIDPNADLWVLTDMSIKISKFNPDLSPLEALVNFKLLQYIITPRSADLIVSQLG